MAAYGYSTLSNAILDGLVLFIFLPLFRHNLDTLCLPAVGIVRVGLNEILPRLGATPQEWL